MNESVTQSIGYDEMLDAVEASMHVNGLVEIPIVHKFSPGLYTRSMVNVPAETFLLSHIHKTEHQFIMSKGVIAIYTEDAGMKVLEAPFIGVTLPGTRRLAKVIEPVTWTSIHATEIKPINGEIETAVKLVEAELYEEHQNIFLTNPKKEEL